MQASIAMPLPGVRPLTSYQLKIEDDLIKTELSIDAAAWMFKAVLPARI